MEEGANEVRPASMGLSSFLLLLQRLPHPLARHQGPSGVPGQQPPAPRQPHGCLGSPGLDKLQMQL